MAFQICQIERVAGGQSVQTYRLSTTDGKRGVEIWPSHGFNCLRWWISERGTPAELLFVRPDWEQDPVPTRSGVPVLFPFPNRIREGRFTFQNRTYQLPCNDPAEANAIHGFTPRKAWRVVKQRIDSTSAEITGEFRLSLDAPEVLPLWPGDCSIRLTCRLEESRLGYVAVVTNDSELDVPFGFGLHPYFQLPTGTPGIADYQLTAPVEYEWELEANLPTGQTRPVPSELNAGMTIGEQVFDHLYGGLPKSANPEELQQVGKVGHRDAGSIEVWADSAFRELILFTPPHRDAVAIEPYTCPTDAANLATDGHDVSWQVLAAGQTWTGRVDFRWRAAPGEKF